jgi:hypothetical protein
MLKSKMQVKGKKKINKNHIILNIGCFQSSQIIICKALNQKKIENNKTTAYTKYKKYIKNLSL